jgi:hypothetical protein
MVTICTTTLTLNDSEFCTDDFCTIVGVNSHYVRKQLCPHHPFTLLHILQQMTQALIFQCIRLCSIILTTQNNSAPCSAGHIPEHFWGDTTKSTSHCLLKVISGLIALLCSSLLHIFAGVTGPCGHFTLSWHLPVKTEKNYGRSEPW